MKHHRLADMIAYYGVELLTAHRALDDNKMNQQVYEHLGFRSKGHRQVKIKDMSEMREAYA